MSIEDSEQAVGQGVCIVGYGIAMSVHTHTTITRLTTTMIVTACGRRFRRERGNLSVPYQPYSGTEIFTTCQRPKGSKR
jgi:hypothetical protein